LLEGVLEQTPKGGTQTVQPSSTLDDSAAAVKVRESRWQDFEEGAWTLKDDASTANTGSNCSAQSSAEEAVAAGILAPSSVSVDQIGVEWASLAP
jgi:hypothetical protein